MVVTSYIFAVTTLVKAAWAIVPVAHEAMDSDSSKVNGLVQEAGLKFAEPKLANFLAVPCQCNYTGEGSWTQLLQYNAIVFGNFETFGSQDILGRLAVGANLMAPGYVININSDQQCYGTNSVPWSQLALAVGGSILSPTTGVHGHWWTAGAGTAIEYNIGCDSPARVDKPFPFSTIQEQLNGYSQAYASMEPNLVLNSDSSITDLGTLPSGCYNVITLKPCHNNDGKNCISPNNWSVPDHILLGETGWNGPSNGYPNPNRLLIINVPVFNGETININSNQPSAGANNCNLIWNFYPADSNGNYLSTGSFNIFRNTGSPFQGVILAPNGNILDGSQGLFQGVLFANSYKWNSLNGVEIHNSLSCNNYGFCTPPGQGYVAQGVDHAPSSKWESSSTTTAPVSSMSSAEATTSTTPATSSLGSPPNAPPPSGSSGTAESSTATPTPSTTTESCLCPCACPPSPTPSSLTTESSTSSAESSTTTSSAESTTTTSLLSTSSESVSTTTGTTQISSTVSSMPVGAPPPPSSASTSNSVPLPSGPMPSTTSLALSPPSPTCIRHKHHHKHKHHSHEKSEKHEDEGHEWDNEKDYEHKDHQEGDEHWDNEKDYEHKDHQEGEDYLENENYQQEEYHDKQKRGESEGEGEEEGYWEDECEYDTEDYHHDDENDKYKYEENDKHKYEENDKYKYEENDKYGYE